MSASCVNCIFWLRMEDIVKQRLFRDSLVTQNGWGYCRRFPRQYDPSQKAFQFPDANENDWCGEWEDEDNSDEVDELDKTDDLATTHLLRLVGGNNAP